MSTMIQKQYLLLATVFCFSHTILANLTTLQHWDPSPIYSANNSLIPPNSHINHLRKARKKDIQPDHKKFFSINISGVVQGACRARDCSGCKEYWSDCTVSPSLENELGNFRGTPYAMGLFLGFDPAGNSIWDTGTNTGDIRNLSHDSIDSTLLPSCLKDIAKIFAGLKDPNTGIENAPIHSTAGSYNNQLNQALFFNPKLTTNTLPSIFSEKKLDDDNVYFGAYSLPLEYKKYGLRLEFTTDICDYFGITIQTGFSNIKHKTTGLVSLSQCPCNNDNNNSSATDTSTLYGQLNFRTDGNITSPMVPTLNNPDAQSRFDRFISDNANKILSTECGIGQEVCDFDEYSIEDLRILLNFKKTTDIGHYTKHEEHPEDWPEMLFTPYLWIGGSFPIADKQNYNKLLSLPFGNNGHASLGGGIGLTFDFKETIEVGFEGGGTYFFGHEETRPMPNHKLQRIIYPHKTKVTTKPGANWHFKAHMNAYQFIKHVNFWATYEFIEHHKDKFELCGNNTFKGTGLNYINTTDETTPLQNPTKSEFSGQIFYPEVLECCSNWRAQFINLGLTFDIQPGMQAGLVWQQPITPRNAYYPVSIIGTFSFMF